MKRFIYSSITVKIIAMVVIFSLINLTFLVWHSEREIENVIFDQVTRQVVVFLQGIEREIQGTEKEPLSENNLRRILDNLKSDSHLNDLDFSINKIYLYNKNGKILAHTDAEPHKNEDLKSYHGDVLRTGKPYISKQIEYITNPSTGKIQSLMDAIIPLHWHGEVVAGIEAEIDLEETLSMIKEKDDHYEEGMFWVQLLHGIILFLLFWWLIHSLLIRYIRRFERVTRSIAEGNFAARIEGFLPNDEVGRLGKSVNFMAESIERLLKEEEEAYLQTLRSLAKALETKDSYTAGHSTRVAKYSVMLGKYLGLSEEQLVVLQKGALMHDLGKIGIADTILNKPSGLTQDEFHDMQSHPSKTATIMAPLKRFKEFAEIAAWHHERWDGKGYPVGLKGEEIPVLARIVSIADTWDAMTGDRVYRKGMPQEKALEILKKERHLGQWDPTMVGVFIQLIENAEINIK
ncbi:MAG: HD domain-containing protein [Magnetococcus sp. DMHC-6]